MKEYKVVIEPEARRDLENIYDFIMTNDTKVKAVRFLRKLQKAIMSLNFMPLRCRQSIYIQGDNIRDMIVQGYTICYIIKEDSVHIVTVFRQRA
ncbi:MAG TPA: type II toxin-antitoxin system RelE/ParE family toxin [Epsilonproteobacteria bacterium]|nr:type II toxin-antitoxin system RelE/ParE family toxin [Campylobacterota bacterium]